MNIDCLSKNLTSKREQAPVSFASLVKIDRRLQQFLFPVKKKVKKYKKDKHIKPNHNQKKGKGNVFQPRGKN